jgi:hypothetical protein
MKRKIKVLIIIRMITLKTKELIKTIRDGSCDVKKIQKLIDEGADVNSIDDASELPLLFTTISFCKNFNVVKLLVKNGANVNSTNSHGDTIIMDILHDNDINNKDINNILFFIQKNININAKNSNGDTALIIIFKNQYAEIEDKIKGIELCINNGADINVKNNDGKTALFYACKQNKLNIVKLLLEKGADPRIGDDPNIPLEIAKEENFSDRINELLLTITGEKKVVAGKLWKGWSKYDSEKLEEIFNPEEANNYSYCPICLNYVRRESGCMYMKHNCSVESEYYHRKLYNIYKNSSGEINWCTICGRIAKGHSHYNLVSHDKIGLVLILLGDTSHEDCRIANGGGGLPEKMARFIALRKTAYGLQSEIDKITEKMAYNKLVEESWDAPLKAQFTNAAKQMLNSKSFTNFSHTIFPNSVAIEDSKEENYPNVKRPNSNSNLIPKLIEGSTITNKLTLDDGEAIQFRHRQPYGTMINGKIIDMMEGEEHQLTREGILYHITNNNTMFGTGEFGKCFASGEGCRALLYPEEVKDFIPLELYETYKKHFNKKFQRISAAAGGQGGGGKKQKKQITRKQKKMRGGNGNTNNEARGFFREATDAVCVLPTKKGGKRKLKLKTRKSKK